MNATQKSKQEFSAKDAIHNERCVYMTLRKVKLVIVDGGQTPNWGELD
jgi:hypothetical protein